MGSFDAAFPRPFGEYLLLQSFGRGGMGEVFLARRDNLGVTQLSVIKTLRSELANDAEYMGRFRDETRVAVQLRHANICQTFDTGSIDGTAFIELEFISGVTLKSYMSQLDRDGSALDKGLAVFIVTELLEALAYAHRHEDPLTGQPLEIVHRDVSPHNVMLSYEGEVKLIDFGLAQSTQKEENTESDIVLGKVAYMAPEQARGDELDAAADQYAAGVLICELLTGGRYFEQRSNQQIWTMVADGGFRPRRFAELPEPVRAVLDKALAHDAADRYPTCDEFLAAFRAAAHDAYGTGSRTDLRASLRRVFAAQMAKQREQLIRQGKETSDKNVPSPGPALPEHSSAQRTPRSGFIEDPEPSPSNPREPGADLDDAIDVALPGDDTIARQALAPRRRTATLGWAAGLALAVVIAWQVLAPDPPTEPTAPLPEPSGALATETVEPAAPPRQAPAPAVDVAATPPTAAEREPVRPTTKPVRKRRVARAAPKTEKAPPPPDPVPAPTQQAPPPARAPVAKEPVRKDVAPPPIPLREAVQIVQSCALGGAKAVRRLLSRIPTASLSPEQGRLVQFWARKCQR